MRGENIFTFEEIDRIKRLLHEKNEAPPKKASAIATQLRHLGFYLSDFKVSQRNITEADIDRLINEGIIIIQKNPIGKVNPIQSITNSLKNLIIYRRSNLYKVLTLIVSFITLWYVIKADKSPPDVYCELELIQRPDSIYQAHFYIWNKGDLPAENIIFRAKRKNVFLADTAKKKIRLNLDVYPYLSVTSDLTPSKVLSLTGNVVSFEDHRIAISKLAISQKYENYFIVLPSTNNWRKSLQSETSVYYDKFIEPKSINKVPDYLEELSKSIQISSDGKLVEIRFKGILDQSQIDMSKYFFPTLDDIKEYRKNASAPYYTLPPLQIVKKLNEKGEENGGSFKGFSKFRGFQRW